MKKEFLDYLYEQRAALQIKIDKQVELNRLPLVKCCNKMVNYESGFFLLEEMRNHIKSINNAIEKYIELHTKPV